MPSRSNILIITAHPSSRNLTEGMAKIYQEEKEKQGHTVKVVDLYKDKQIPFLTFENRDDLTKKDELREYYQEQIIWAEQIVIIYPLWWGTIPAILKNLLDMVLAMSFAFEAGKNGYPHGLLQGRSVRVITTSATPKFYYVLNGICRANSNIWKKTIIKFCGMKFDGFHLYGGADTSDERIDKMFVSVRKLAQN